MTATVNAHGKQKPLTEEAAELLTSPLELGEYKNAIMDAMYRGTKRYVESEDDSASEGDTTKKSQIG